MKADQQENQETQQLNINERYKFVTSQIQYFNDKIIEAFRMFIQIVTAITGGYIAVRTQTDSPEILIWAGTAASALMIFVGFTIVLLIVDNLSSWWGFRKSESSLLNGKVPPPTFPKSASHELLMIVVVIVASSFGAWYFYR